MRIAKLERFKLPSPSIPKWKINVWNFQKCKKVIRNISAAAKILWKPSTIGEALYPSYLVSKIFGLAPYQIHPSKRMFHIWDVFYSCLVLAFIAGLLYENITYQYWLHYVESGILVYGIQFQMTSGLILSVVYSSCHLFHRKRFNSIIENLKTVDQSLKEIGVKIKYTYSRNVIILEMAINCLGLFLIMLGNWIVHTVILKSNVTWITYTSYFVANMMFYLVLSQFFHFVCTIRLRFKEVNNILEQSLPSNKYNNFLKTTKNQISPVVLTHGLNRYSGIKNKPHNIWLMKMLCKTHDSLCDLAETINECYSVQIMLGTAWAFVYILFGAFSFYRMLVSNDADLAWYIVDNLAICCYYATLLLTTISMCSSSTRNGSYTAVLIHKLINDSWDELMLKQLQSFSMQLFHRRPVFSCGLFHYDWTLLYSMIGAGSTYLIILVQFDMTGAVGENTSEAMNQSLQAGVI